MQVITIIAVLGFIASCSATSFYVKPKCPESNNENYVVLPNLHDCKSYYRCVNGEPRIQYCSEGLHFNLALMTCDFPEQAGCQQLTLSRDNAEPKLLDHPKSCDQNKVTCPVQSNNDEDIKLANPDDCGSFCHCVHGFPWWTPCPPGLHFNKRTENCDYPKEAECEKF